MAGRFGQFWVMRDGSDGKDGCGYQNSVRPRSSNLTGLRGRISGYDGS